MPTQLDLPIEGRTTVRAELLEAERTATEAQQIKAFGAGWQAGR